MFILGLKAKRLVPKTPSTIVVNRMWIRKMKFSLDRLVQHYKACLVALGNHQQIGIDYHKIFGLVVKCSIDRLVLFVALSCN